MQNIYFKFDSVNYCLTYKIDFRVISFVPFITQHRLIKLFIIGYRFNLLLDYGVNNNNRIKKCLLSVKN